MRTRGITGGVSSPGVPLSPAALRSGLASYWPLGELSGTRNDSVSTRHLTDINTVGYGAARQGDVAASFSFTNLETLVYYDNLGIPWYDGTAMTIKCWVKLTGGAFPTYPFFIAHGGDGGRDYELAHYQNKFQLYWAGVSRLQQSYVRDNLWHFLVARFSGNGGGVGTWQLRVDGNSWLSGTFAASRASHTPATSFFRVSGYSDPVVDTEGCMDGLVQKVGVWTRVITDGEVDQLFSNGSGSFWPF